MRRNILSFVEDYAKRGGATAFVHSRGLRTRRWSYERVAQTAWKFARELEARRIERGDRVLLRAENSPEWVAAFFGCALRGAIVVPLDLESAPDFVSRVRAQTAARLLLVDDEQQASVDLPSLNLAELDQLLARHSSEPYKAEDVGAEDLVEIVYTSGTTTEPRGVLLTHQNLLANISPLEKEIQKYLKWERLVHPLRFLNLLPLSHVFGQFMCIFVPQLLGGEVFFQNSLSPSDIIKTTRRERISVIVTVPRLLESLREHIERDWDARGKSRERLAALERADGWSVQRRLWAFREVHKRFGWKFWAFVAGGATLSPETESFWQRTGFAIIQGYGMTETASLISVNHPFKKSRGSIGRTLPGQEIKLSDEGEIMVRGANVTNGYWATNSETLKSEDGWLRTGDVGRMDAEGNLYFKGRKKDVIVTAAGVNIHAEDLEAALHSQPEVLEAVVIPFDSANGPEPFALLIMRDMEASPERAVERANQRLARHQQIRRWLVWPEPDFPRTATQKIRKRDVARIVKAQLSGQSTRPEHSAMLEEIVSRITSSACERMASTSELQTDLKLDSLGRVELLSALEDRYQIELDEAAFTAATTLGDVEEVIRRGAQDRAPQYPYPEWARSAPVRWLRLTIFYLFVLPLTSLMCWARVRGLEHLSGLKGPVLFVSNHVAMVDHALILSALPGRFRRRLAIAMEGEILRDWVHTQAETGWLTRLRYLIEYTLVVTLFNVFPLPKKSGFRRSFAYAGEMMDKGYSVLVFPEGVRTEDGRMNRFMTGIGLLAANLETMVVPIRIDGLFELKRLGRHFAWPFEVSITFGEAVRFERTQDAAHIARELQARVEKL